MSNFNTPCSNLDDPWECCQYHAAVPVTTSAVPRETLQHAGAPGRPGRPKVLPERAERIHEASRNHFGARSVSFWHAFVLISTVCLINISESFF